MPPYLRELPELKTGRQNIPKLLLLGQQLKEARRERTLADLGEQREKQRFEWEKEDRVAKRLEQIQNLNTSQLEFSDKLLGYAVKVLPMVNWDPQQRDYQAFRQHLIGVGFDEKILPESFGSELEFQGWKNDAMNFGKSLKEQYETEIKRREAEEGPKPEYDQQTIYGPGGQTKRVSVKKGEDYTPPEGWSLTKPEDKDEVPGDVKQAQSLVLKLAKKIDPMMAALISTNSEMANSPLVKKAIESVGVPKDLKPAYDKAIQVLNEYYGVESEEAGGDLDTSSITHEFVPGKGLVEVGK